MKVLVLENNQEDLKECLHLIQNFEKEIQCPIEIVVESNYSKVLKNSDEYDVVFFDIELDDEVNGIELACEVRRKNKDIRIVFMSNFNKYLIAGYQAQANLYLLKPFHQEEFNKSMKIIVEDYIYYNLGIMDTSLSQTKIYYKDIMYFEVLSRKLNIHFINGKVISCYESLMKWQERLKQCPFVQPHRSFLVNMQHIDYFEKDIIVMKDGTQIPLTEHYFSSFREAYICFMNRR